MNIIEMKCASCGGNLKITPEIDQFSCGYCGSAQIVQRAGGTVVLRRVTDAISKVQAGTDRTAAELALVRLKSELIDIDQQLANSLTLYKDNRSDSEQLSSITGSEWLSMVVFIFSLFAFAILLWALTWEGEVGAQYFAIFIAVLVVLIISARKAFRRTFAEQEKRYAGNFDSLNSEREKILGKICENQDFLNKNN